VKTKLAGELFIVLFMLIAGMILAFAGFEWDAAHPMTFKTSKPSSLREWLKRNFGAEMKD
jgi:hypothetical protein